MTRLFQDNGSRHLRSQETEFDESGRPIENTLYSYVYEVGTQTGPVHMFREEQEHHRNTDQDTKYEWKTDAKITLILKSYSGSIEFPQINALSSEQRDMKRLCDEKGLKLPKDMLRYLSLFYQLIAAGESM